jgi:hypothetical protein
MVAAAAVLTVVAVIGVLAFFNSRDDSTISERGGAAPGQADPKATRDELKRGNVVLHFDNPADAPALRRLAREFGPASLADAGEAVLVRRTPGTPGIAAEAYRRRLETPRPDDPRLREFIDYWLGLGAVP